MRQNRRVVEEKTYEMLWDCQYCGSKKLLGLSHRFCPNCGAAQDPEKRYFPAENEKVAVQEHEYFGADRVCAACKTASGAKVKFCRSCASPMEAAAAVKLIPEAAAAKAPSSPDPVAPPPKKPVLGPWLTLGSVVLAATFLLRTRSVVLSVAGHEWVREIHVEKFGLVQKKAWCGEMPADAREISRRKEVRARETVADGENCKPVKKDRGDGTYAESQDCTPKTREKLVYSDLCEYAVKSWQPSGTQRSAGSALTPQPHWPQEPLARQGECVGCERLGLRGETYTVRLSGEGRVHRCDFTSQAQWEAMPVGSRWRSEKRALTGGLLCGTLVRAD